MVVQDPSVHWTEYGIPIRNLWYMLLYVWGQPPLNRLGNLDEIEDAPSLDYLLASVLVKLVEQRIRIGLGCNYIEERHILRGIRGRVSFSENIKRNAFEHGQAFCDFYNYSANVPKNQIIRSTLMRLIQVGQLGNDLARANDLRHKMRFLTRSMGEVDLVELKPGDIHRLQLGRNDRDYRLMLAICELIVQRQIPADSSGYNPLPSIERSSLVMHQIYERFVANFYSINLTQWRVTPQARLHWYEEPENRYLPAMYPDLLLEEKLGGRVIVLDTKFTAASLTTSRWDKQTFNSSHLYQLYTYVKTQAHLSECQRRATGILLYPTIQQADLTEEMMIQDQKLMIATVDLTLPWQIIEQRLLDIIFHD